MNLRKELEEYRLLLESNKINERKKVCDRFSHLLENEEVITLLNEDNCITWKQVISSVQECLRKDADKIVEDAKKKGSVNMKYPSSELFVQVIKVAVREAEDKINVTKIVGYIIGCMRDSKMKKCYDTTFLLVLKEYILQNSKCRGRLESEDWTELFRLLKKLCEERPFEMLVLKCFMLLIKWGPTSGLPPSILREEFEFITKLCQLITQNSLTNQQEDVLDIALDFCRHNAKDNRVSCCKLGEDVFSNFIELYELNGREAKIKKQLVEFFLLQVLIHQPNGVTEGHSCAYAFCWATWRKCLKMMYSLLSKEISFYFKFHHKNSSFFITNGDSTTLLDTFSTLFVEVSRQLFVGPDLDVTTSVGCSLTSQGSQKRQRMDVHLKIYIKNIQETKSWLWAFGLNQHKQATEYLLEKLIHKGIIDLDTVIQSYTSGVLNISVQSISTMDAALQYLTFNKSDEPKKELLMNCIVNSQNIKDYDYLVHPKTATFLVNLTLKQWPMSDSNGVFEKQNIDKYCDIKDVYFKSILEQNVLPLNKVVKTEFSDNTFNVDFELTRTLVNVIQNYVDSISPESVEHLLSIIVLLVNITKCMIQYKILNEKDINNCLMMRLVEKIFNYNVIKKFDLYGNKNDREAKRLLECIAILDKLLTFLSTFKYSKPGVIMDSVFDNVLKSVEEICFARYHITENATEILNVLSDLYPHIAVTNDESNKIMSVALLNPFYEKRDHYGPKVSLALLNCMGRLCEIDPESNFSRWHDIEIVKYVPAFLCSDYQEIRFKAIETLVIFFQVMSKSKQLQDFHRQEEIFSKMYEMSLKVFEVTGEITQERRTDEIISRTASVLHTFTSIILCCNSWIEECLFALVKLTYEKNLDKYLEYILEKWLNEAYIIDNFPFRLFQCETKFEFYLKYFEACVPLLIVTDRKDLVIVAKQMGFSEKDIVEKTCPKIFARALCDEIENMENLIKKNKILCYYVHVVSLDGLKKFLIDNLDQLLLCTLSFLTDEKYIYDSFEETVIFSSQNLSVQQFKRCLNFIEALLCEGTTITLFLTKNNLSKLEKILLSLKLNIYNVFTTDDKLKSFHRYVVWINIVLDSLQCNSSFQYFFIRDTTYTLINLIENHKDNSNFTTGVCKVLDSFFKKILPSFAETFETFLIFTVNSLKNYSIQINSISDICIEILRFLIVQNACHLMSSIEKLDNFPQQPKFESIRIVHTNIKYGKNGASLEDEINSFLQHEDLSTRQDSLVHLRNTLSKEKVQLKKLYDKLQYIRGFSEDCEKSLLHRLICMLAKMSCSANENVRFEAIKCLGELGPANLMTLVLQPEKGVSDIKCTPFELLSGHIVSLLSGYIVDTDINIVKTASEALYIVLGSKEGRKVAESGVNFGYGLIDKRCFCPYIPDSKSTSASSAIVLTEVFKNKINVDKLWCPDNHICHKKWIVSLVTSLLETFTDKSYLPKLIPICKATPKFCEHLLPLILNILLYINNKDITEVLSKKINVFFASHWNFTVPKYEAQNSITVNKKSVKCMLNVVKFVRLQKSYAQTRARQVGELELNYLKVAKGAEFCAAHFTALLYSELWCQARLQDIQNGRQNSELLVGSTMLDVIYENEEEKVGEALQNILRNAYKAIGDLNALPGCGISFLLKSQFRVEYYKELGNWDQVTHFYEMQVSNGIDSVRKDLMESLKKCSLYQLPLLCTNQSDESQYECLWRLAQWSAEENRVVLSENSLDPINFEKYRFFALKALHDSNEYAFAEAKKSQILCVIEHLRHTSLESSQNLYPILTQLQALNEMEDFAEAMQLGNFVSVLNKWKLQDDLVRRNDFQYIEPVVAQRIIMLMATKALGNLLFMSDLTDDVKTKIQLMDAQLSWSVNNKLVSRHILNKLCKNEGINPRLRSAALKLSGQYMSETFSESRLTIISEYFLKSISIIKDVERTSEDCNSILDTYDKLAQFADKGYQQIMMYMKSDLFQRKIINMEKAKKAASDIQRQSNKTYDERKAASIHVKQSNIDEIEIHSTNQERNNFLKIALKYYVLNLVRTDKNNIRIFRVMALCLENKTNPVIFETLKQTLPSYKYITMLPQLIPHITENNSDLYSNKVNEIVEKCAIEHPHHTLPLILSLANANKDREFSDPTTKTSSNDARMATANNLIKKLKRREELVEHINKLQQLSQALIELAYYKDVHTASSRKKEFNIPRSQKITRIQNFDDILLPTYNLPINKSCDYSNIVGITSFSSVYHPVGGINHPKRITCRGTDGKVRSQLLKGCDDLRQDAVMEQVFTIMNNLLATNKQTRNLLIRTYKIVPLSMRSGILEWVDDSMPIGAYLVGDPENNQPGAHQLYRPNDKSPSSCRDLFKKCADKSAELKMKTFNNICKDFKPVFHKFFESSFPHPTNWYERRRAYIHSVATTSMCGYILGIGDRHVSNILIDKTTAEVIHIDFGIAFEQGRVLPTPETVPFRLTRDIVDGMGVSGVEGIFRRSCEKNYGSTSTEFPNYHYDSRGSSV
ncbi:hypothetical protein NQ314_013683 [Rhamnusium bicolor]|uniref:Serine/threonine-protein kinase ATM n=1 Tax=Rhamnusium bicolor TaxID=1586634 RepID=A0AAV8X7J6_9CUCU|nr:hypothetical protein NQ314_013683 [Rhamnusium bicolor]